jgi:hypothetical protein
MSFNIFKNWHGMNAELVDAQSLPVITNSNCPDADSMTIEGLQLRKSPFEDNEYYCLRSK